MDQIEVYFNARFQPLEALARENGTAEQIEEAQSIVSAAKELCDGCPDGAAFEQRFAASPLFDQFNALYAKLFMQGPQATPFTVAEAAKAAKETRAQLSEDERASIDREMKESLQQAARNEFETDARLLAKEARVAIGRESYQRMREESPAFRELESAANTFEQVKRIGRLFGKK